MTMENAEEIFQSLEEFSKRKVHVIPSILEDYLLYVAQTGDPVFQWTLVKQLIKEKLLCIIKEFHESNPGLDIPPCPNVDPFNFETMKRCLLERLDMFAAAPFTIQRMCELLSAPRKQYSRIDKFMRAMEKNILVVSTREPGTLRHVEYENGDHTDSLVNGSDSNSEYNVDVEMEDTPWKENDAGPVANVESQNGNVDAPMQIQDEINSNYESVTPPESDSSSSDSTDNFKPAESMEEFVEETSIKLVTMTHSPGSTEPKVIETKQEMCEIKAIIPESTKLSATDIIEESKIETDLPVTEGQIEQRTTDGSDEKVEKSDANLEIFEESNSSNFSENTDSSSSDSDKVTHHIQNENSNGDSNLDLPESKDLSQENGKENTSVTMTLNEKESFSDADLQNEDVKAAGEPESSKEPSLNGTDTVKLTETLSESVCNASAAEIAENPEASNEKVSPAVAATEIESKIVSEVSLVETEKETASVE